MINQTLEGKWRGNGRENGEGIEGGGGKGMEGKMERELRRGGKGMEREWTGVGDGMER